MTSYVPAPGRYTRPMDFYRRSGSSGILLPAVSLGLWKGFGAEQPFSHSRDILHYAFDHGITHFDLANNYGPPYGSAEETFGRVMQTSFHPYRNELFIATKAGYDMWPGPYGNWGSRKYLLSSLDESLRRMHLDYVDLFYSHRYDPLTPLDETLQALVDAVKSGKALYAGISRWPLEATTYALRYLSEHDVPCLTYQGRFNLLDHGPLTEGILSLLRERKCGFVSFSPLAQGLLAGRYLDGIPAGSRMRAPGTTLKEATLTPELHRRLVRLNEFAAERGMTLPQLALRYVLDEPATTSVIVGVSNCEQLSNNLATMEFAPLNQTERSELFAIMEA